MTDEDADALSGVNGLYMLFCIALLGVAILGVALFYSGLTQRRSAFSILGVSLFLAPLVIIDWYIWSYSMCYGSNSNGYIGSLKFAVLRQLRDENQWFYNTPKGDILLLNHFLFNGLMKVICVALTFPGAIAERGRILPMLVFFFCWSWLIYNPVTYWFWNRNGWLSVEKGSLPVLDFAGGNCIHVVSGYTVLAYSYILGPRNPKILNNYRNSNSSWVLLGTYFIVCGWLGFIAGCDYKFLVLSLSIMVSTLICGSVSGLIWASIDYYYSSIPLAEPSDYPISDEENAVANLNSSHRSNPETEHSQLEVIANENGSLHLRTGIWNQSSNPRLISQPLQSASQPQQTASQPKRERRKFSLISFLSGIITGLVVITPGGGYVCLSSEFWKLFVFGVIGAIVANLSTRLKYYMNIDDTFDIFAIHGVAGIVGSILTGIFTSEGYGTKGGWVEGHWKQIGYQILGCVVVSSYVFVMSCFFLYVIDMIPYLHLRIDKDFNKRQREQKSSGEAGYINHEITESEMFELNGTDAYEFNGEFMMDFMEFIKVIRPEDYESEEDYTEKLAWVSGSSTKYV